MLQGKHSKCPSFSSYPAAEKNSRSLGRKRGLECSSCPEKQIPVSLHLTPFRWPLCAREAGFLHQHHLAHFLLSAVSQV